MLPQVVAMIEGETNRVSVMANVAAALHEAFQWWWTGFYTVEGDPDVDQFPGHIACSSLSRSEIVVPVHDSTGEVVAVLDIDSKELSTFDETDKIYLEKLVAAISKELKW